MKKLTAFILTLALAVSFTACGQKADTLKVGATAAPHAEILNFIKPMLEEKGITLEVIEFTDYPLLNTALNEKQIDANYFQHKPYLDQYNEANKTDLISAGAIHFEPLGVYGGKRAAIADLQEGDTIAIPNDPTNGARALLLLEENGVITLKGDKKMASTANDIDQNKLNIKISEVDASQIPNTLQDVALGVINGNYAIGAGIADKVLVSEDPTGDVATDRANIVAVRKGDENREDIKTLVAALQSEETRKFITDKYGISVVPVF
ncbi:MAG: MetQ/NlpA family ABC transporter substrate-binding protein [Oscillospiraceae bacterium]